MSVINLQCKKCKRIFCHDVGSVSFPPDVYKGKRPNFEKDIHCKGRDILTLNEVELTGLGQTQLTEIWLTELERL